LGELARRLDEAEIGFTMKVLAHPRAYLRRDSCVIYIGSVRLPWALEIIWRSIANSSTRLDDPVPALTRRLAPGFGFADNPSDIKREGLSHGQWVSGIFLNAAQSFDTITSISAAVSDAIVASGRDPALPYMRPEHAMAPGFLRSFPDLLQ